MRACVYLRTVAAAAMFLHATLAQSAMGSCEAKRAHAARDIENANANANANAKDQTRRVSRLEKTLRKTQVDCTDANLQKAPAARIAGQEKMIAERRRDLEKARIDGKTDKISLRKAKLADEEAAL